MAEDKNKITFRADPDERQKWDEKRVKERETWTSLGVRFFTKWANGDDPLVLPTQSPVDMIPPGLTSGEYKWLQTYMETGLEALRLAKETVNDAARASRINGLIESADAVADSAEEIAKQEIAAAKELRRTGPANPRIAGGTGKVKRKAV